MNKAIIIGSVVGIVIGGIASWRMLKMLKKVGDIEVKIHPAK